MTSFAQLHASVAEADPLSATTAMLHLPTLNREADLVGIIRLLAQILPDQSQVTAWTRVDSAAAMRDIGFLLGSIKRHGKEPTSVVPGLENLLLALARRTDLPPRETLLHVTVWNPAQRQIERTYTGLAEERDLLHSVRLSMGRLESAVMSTAELWHLPICSAHFQELSARVAADLGGMVESVVHAYRTISPAVFASELRPYYEPIEVCGTKYLGPGAVEMPLFVLDHILWGSSLKHGAYATYRETYVPYILPELRQLYQRFSACPSLIDRVVEWFESDGKSKESARRSLANIDYIFETLIKFRAPHLRLAEKTYEKKEDYLIGCY